MANEPPSNDPHPDLGAVEAKIYALLIAHPEGLNISEIRQALGVGEGQEHLDRRIRALYPYYVVDREFRARKYTYILRGPRDQTPNSQPISGRVRAHVLHLAKGRCQMCGRTIAEDGVKLQIDHKVPQSWGGLNVQENLWAICEQCNNGKRDHFNSFDEAELRRIVSLPSVHERIAHLLKTRLGQPVSSRLLEFVANSIERQDDWQKRLRELRYPPIGLEIAMGKQRTPEGYVESTYTLKNWRDLPEDHKQLIREWENRHGKTADG